MSSPERPTCDIACLISLNAGTAWRRKSSMISEMPRAGSNAITAPSGSGSVPLPGTMSMTAVPMTPDSRACRAKEPCGMRAR